ncbi:methyl-CpG-binding domain protein 6 [Periophthalmus magnuspinnatus]|uniref:methyl-CpG-binding domain protein 6 n=1 Tax=Periophthalmus magnuspinnatus TaxID=409849 RepID=UPI00145A7DD5|nr:methyl-CpG-binding domain protein 6 [Periophthalmus magnuspinnatus]XP_055079074.1 methyl-CpG-binding domain protein 6 [Periophthalmus magnuspinnatus]
MMGGSETVSGDQDGLHSTAVHVPIGWQRRVEGARVLYISPSGTSLSSLDEVKTYLLTDGTCKCGLECPLVLHKVFNFALGVKVEQCSQPVGKVEQDMTKLCNHRRKVVAMAALCRSMQASQLPFSSLHHSEVTSGMDSCHPKRPQVERGEDHPKLPLVTGRSHNTCVSPPSPRRFIYPQNGSSPILHSTNHHSLDSIRRLHHPPPLPPCSTSNQSFSGYRSPRTPTPLGPCPGQRTPKTPDTPGSPRFGPLASPPPSSPVTLAGARTQSHQTHGSPLSSPHSHICMSPQQRSRHPSASPSPASEHGEAGGRRKSTSSSPHSPLPCASPNTNTHFPKYKLEDILEQFKHSGSANNHHLPFTISPSVLSSQSHQPLSQKPPHPRVPCPSGYGLSSVPSNSHMPFMNHHSHNRPHQSPFPASSLLSAAAKAQIVNQITQGQAPNVGSSSVSVDSSLEGVKEAQQQHKSKVTNSTLHNSYASPPSTTCPGPPHPSLLHPSHPLAQPHSERGASHRKRQRRSPTVLSVVRGAQQLVNGPRSAPADSCPTAINLSTPRLSSTSALLSHHLPLEKQLRLPPPRLAAISRTKGQTEALDFTTGSPLALEPPTQPLSALLHLLSVQNAQNASASADANGDTKPMNKAPVFPSTYTKQTSDTNPSLSTAPLFHSQSVLQESSTPQKLSPTAQPSPMTSSAPTFSQTPLQQSSPHDSIGTSISSAPAEMSHCQGSGTPGSPKPLDLSTHVLALLAQAQADPTHTPQVMSSQENHCAGSEEPVCLDPKSPVAKPTASPSPAPPAMALASAVGDSAPSPLAEAFPFMNQEQLLQLLSSGSLPSLLDPTVLASLPLGGLWLGGQQGTPTNPPPQALTGLSEQPDTLLIQSQDQHKQMNPLFPLLPLLSAAQGELPFNLLGLVNPIPPAASPTSIPGQDGDLGLSEKPGMQALLMASLLLGQPLSGVGQVSLEVPLQQPTLDSLSLEKGSGLMDPAALSGTSLLELPQGLLPISAGSEGQLLLPPPTTFLPLSPALLTAALSSAELHPPPNPQLGPAQQTQQTPPPQAEGVDTLIPLPLQSKDSPLLQQLLPTLLNTAVLGDLSNMAGLQNMMGLGAGSILLPPVQASALAMPLLQSPDGTINLLNNLQLSIATSSEEEKPVSMETESPIPQGDIPANQMTPDARPPEVPSPPPEPLMAPPKAAGPKPVIDPYTSFMDTIYTSFLQVSAREQEEGARSGPSDPTSPFCALPPVSFPLETLSPPAPPLSQASAPVSLSPRRACSLRNPDLSRLSLEAAAHSPAQGTPRPTEDGPVSLLHRKNMPPIYLEEAQTDCTRPAAVCPYMDTGERKRLLPPPGYLSPGDSCREDTTGSMLLDQHTSDAVGGLAEARRGRKRKQLLHNVLEDFRELDTAALEEAKDTTALLKSDRSVRGRRRRGTRSQRQ